MAVRRHGENACDESRHAQELSEVESALDSALERYSLRELVPELDWGVLDRQDAERQALVRLADALEHRLLPVPGLAPKLRRRASGLARQASPENPRPSASDPPSSGPRTRPRPNGRPPDDDRLPLQRRVTGACLAIRRELFLDLGGFDEAYVNGLEDIDLCLRLRCRGLRVVYRGDACLVHHESLSRGVNLRASAHNDAVFEARWGELCAPDDELAAGVFGGRLTMRAGLPPIHPDCSYGAGISIEGHLRSVAAEAAEARALLRALEHAGVSPCARDRPPAWLVAGLSETEQRTLTFAEARLRSPTALRIELPVGSFYAARRRHGDVLRLATPPRDPAHLAGVAAVWAATPAVAEAIIELGVAGERVAYLPPPIAPPPRRRRRRSAGAAARARPRGLRPSSGGAPVLPGAQAPAERSHARTGVAGCRARPAR